MTIKNLQSILVKANKGDTNSIHVRPLENNVDFAIVWFEKHKAAPQFEPLPCYLIKDIDNQYVGIVYDMKYDLHWYLASRYRKKGYLTKAMKEVILFHLFQSRDIQYISIDESEIGSKNYQASIKVATALGFEKDSDNTFVLKSEHYKTEEWLDGYNTDITQERVCALKQQLKDLSYSLWKIQTEIEMKLGTSDCTEDIKRLVDEVKRQALYVEDEYWDFKGIN